MEINKRNNSGVTGFCKIKTILFFFDNKVIVAALKLWHALTRCSHMNGGINWNSFRYIYLWCFLILQTAIDANAFPFDLNHYCSLTCMSARVFEGKWFRHTFRVWMLHEGEKCSGFLSRRIHLETKNNNVE